MTGERFPDQDSAGRPFGTAELERLSKVLGRFLPHADLTAVALTGGVAIQVHCHGAGWPAARTTVADLDFVATEVRAISPSVSRSLLVSHFHLPQPGYPKFMVQVVDRATRIRIDVFPDLAGSIVRSRETRVAGYTLRVLDAASILDHKRGGMALASASRPIDEKHQRDATLLGRLCGQHVDPLPAGFLTRDVYEKNLTPCARCEASRTPGFPIASRERVFEVLGYN